MDTTSMTMISRDLNDEVAHLFRQVITGMEELQDKTGIGLDIYRMALTGQQERWNRRTVIDRGAEASGIDLAAERELQQALIGQTYEDASHGQ